MSNTPIGIVAVAALGLAGYSTYSAVGAHGDLTDLRAKTADLEVQNAELIDGLEKTSAKLADQGDNLSVAANIDDLTLIEDITQELSDRVLELESKTNDPFVSRVRVALLDEPDMLFAAVEEFERRQVSEQAAAFAGDLNDDPFIPVLGNPDGDVTVVEFFDYNCGYCRRAMEDVLALVEEDGNIRLILKEFPILSEESRDAALVAMAAVEYADYNTLHQMGMTTGGTTDAESMYQNAELIGADRASIEGKLEFNRDVYMAALARNQQVGQALGITGTPAFYIEGTVIPGAVGKAQLAEIVAQIRADRAADSEEQS